MRDVFDDLFVLRGHRVMSWSRAAVYLLLMAACTGWWYRADAMAVVPLPEDGHAVTSLSVAVNRSFCGFPSRLSYDTQVGRLFIEDRKNLTLPVSTVIVNRWKTVDRYCATVTVPYLNNENSLMLLDSWIMRFVPDVSLAGIGRIMLILRILTVLLFCLALLRGGMSVLVCAGVVSVAAAILHQLQPVFAYSVYSFFLPLTVLPIAIYLLSAEASRRIPIRLAVAFLGGLVSAYGVNMRTSYLPLYAAMFLLYLAAGEWLRAERRRAFRQRVVVSVAAMAVFGAGYGAFHYGFIIRSREPGVTNLSYHVIWHSVAMSLAAPPNPLSEREGIRWNDGTGWELARRVNPSVPYLGPGYEEALSAYYFGLWEKYPSEMRQIYVAKFKLGGQQMIKNASFPSRWMTAILAILAYVPNGLSLLAGLIACCGASLWWHVRSGHPALLALTYVTGVGTLLLVEAAAIMPYYYLSYQSTLLFACAVTTLFLGQLVLNAPVWLVERLMPRRTREAIAEGG